MPKQSSEFVTTLAHEIRNPLNNIDLSVKCLETEIKQDDITLYLDIIRRNSKRINNLVNEILQFKKPDTVSARDSINNLLDESLELAKDRIMLKSIRVLKLYNQDTCEITVNEPDIRIAFLNIFINAIEAMPANKGVLKVSTFLHNDKCMVTIEDNGIGISKENIGKLFVPFFTSKPNGVGLGLAATKSILKHHKGLISVESTEGIGTRFIISFRK